MNQIVINTDLLHSPFKGTEGIDQICFVGIGGIGMSALARFFLERGIRVSGYDKTRTALTQQLEKQGMNIHYEDQIENVDKEATVVVYTPAIPGDHQELNWYKKNGYTVWKRSDLLQRITDSSLNICIAGTHGKTTTSTLVAHILRDSQMGCNAFLGGIASNYETNYWSSRTNCCVVEADEYDRSFLKLKPQVAVITAMDPDHLDIYGTAAEMEEAFLQFSSLVAPDGLLIYKKGLKRATELRAKQLCSYHLNDTTADCYATDLKVEKGSYHFSVHVCGKTLAGFELSMGGLHNVENTVAAVSIASMLGIEESKIKKAVASFRGVQRRFEVIWKDANRVWIDDYAHHPAELQALITGVRSLYGSKKCTIIFQPHLYTRTRDLAKEFGEALSGADEVILLPIYPARELPIEGVSSELIKQNINDKPVSLFDKNQVLSWFTEEMKKENEQNVIITAGAGDIDQLLPTMKNIIR
ncbi:MAG TPA: UDP-N-acetylmuramate--L-alanine ligase [Chitinophagaceae bacterium]|nr:UDP-N-acetylmuramate--L-alanine ligase [Chitinophagaceae bacterium]